MPPLGELTSDVRNDRERKKSMGCVTLGIPQEIAIELARLNGSTIFIETGTFQGSTTRWASNYFEIVQTIERAEDLYRLHSKALAEIKGVIPHLGDSRDILPQIVKDIGARKALYWLDGHWSGGETAGQNDECPLLDELACLSGRTEDIILIDDARLFLCAPPSPHNASQWPTIADIVAVLLKSGQEPFVQIVDDVIFVIPNKHDLRTHLVEYAQRRSNCFWEEFCRLSRERSSPRRRFRSILSKLRRAITSS
jgi:hypothetical protein